MSKCVVYDNCLNSWGCEHCEDYERYYPKKTKILSPRQIRNKETRKEQKRARRNTDASKRGRANRATGRRTEISLEKMLQSWSIPCSRVPMSGILKGANLIGVPDDILSGDIRAFIYNAYRKIEVKRRGNLKTYYGKVEENIVHIENFCYMMNELDFKILIQEGRFGDTIEVPDAKFKALHDYFNQDNSDIVAMRMNTRPFIFAVSQKLVEEILNGRTK